MKRARQDVGTGTSTHPYVPNTHTTRLDMLDILRIVFVDIADVGYTGPVPAVKGFIVSGVLCYPSGSS
jgi:hypothetical protein